jgi:hypothetical protein
MSLECCGGVLGSPSRAANVATFNQRRSIGKTELERETGIEPATNGLGSRDSTTELLPLMIAITAEIVTLCAIFKHVALGRRISKTRH